MAIEKNAVSGGNFIKVPGEYRVKITETKTGMSKTQKPMLTVTFESHDGQSIRGYFVKTLTFHMSALEKLKIACGLKVTDQADMLVGKECGILVESGETDSNGRIFMSITGYGPANQVGSNGSSSSFAEVPADEIPF